MRAALALALLSLAACVDRLPPAEVVSGLQILAVKAEPNEVLVVSGLYSQSRAIPIWLATLAMDPGGLVRDASFEYGLCGENPVFRSGPPDCLPPKGTALPATGELALLEPAKAAPWLDLGSDAGLPEVTLYVSVRVRASGREAVALKRVPVLGYYDVASAGRLSVDGVTLDGVRPGRVTQGSHLFEVNAGCDLGDRCEVSWRVTGGLPALSSTLLGDELNKGPSFEWIAPSEPGRVTVVAVVRNRRHGGAVAWNWGTLEVEP